MNKMQFLAGLPFSGGRLLYTKFRFNGEFIEQQDFSPVEDRWTHYCSVSEISETGFKGSIIFLGRNMVESEFLFQDLHFSEESILDEGEIWTYEWVEMAGETEMLVRYRTEETLDRMQKLCTEPLAYLVGNCQPLGIWEWTAFRYGTDLSITLFKTTTNYKTLRYEVEEYFRNKPDEDSTVFPSSVP